MISSLVKLRQALPRLLTLDRRIDEVKINQGLILSEMHRQARCEHLWEYEFKVFSQWGEDGIIQHLTSHLRIECRTFIEFGVEDFREANCRYLLMKDHWSGFVIDGSSDNIERLRSSYFFWQYPLTCKASFITRENVPALLDESGFNSEELGLLSVDIDGVDYHVLEALGQWRPAILIVEFNEVFGSARAVSVPYDELFVRSRKHSSNLYYGANLPAFVHLATKRGYALVGTNRVGSNAFFVRRDLLNERVSEVSLTSCTQPASFRESRGHDGELTYLSGSRRARAIADMPLVDVITGEGLTVGDLFE